MNNKNPGQQIFRFATVERLRNDLRSGVSLESYFKESFDVQPEELQPSTILPQGKTPTLDAPEDNPVASDIENAIALHGYYSGLDETQASDPRLWTYLSHVQFREYSLARWGYGGIFKDLNQEDKSKAINYFLEHWFVGSNDRDLRRHAIARLWWAAHLTHAPWEAENEYFSDIEKDDPYFYTRILFSTQDIYQQVLERAMGRSNRILISVLDYLATHTEFAGSREKVRTLMKELNLAYGSKKLIVLERPALKALIEQVASEIIEL